MSNRKKIITVWSICVTAVSLLFLGSCAPLNSITYSSAKEECEIFLEENRNELEKLALAALSSDEDVSGYYNERYYSSCLEDGFVAFDVDAQGMLGGQYWGLVYTQDGTYCGDTESYLQKQEQENNIMRGERLDGHWWYRWRDYDGTDRSYQ